jgi:hypothetical protein
MLQGFHQSPSLKGSISPPLWEYLLWEFSLAKFYEEESFNFFLGKYLKRFFRKNIIKVYTFALQYVSYTRSYHLLKERLPVFHTESKITPSKILLSKE